jgi:aldehyde dehydrogenase
VQTEQFGPILPIVPYRDIDQGITFCNQSRYGLGASVWSADVDQAEQLLVRIKTGVGFVNSHKRTPLGDRKMPFGGSKMSGLGRNRTAIGFAEYTETYARSSQL